MSTANAPIAVTTIPIIARGSIMPKFLENKLRAEYGNNPKAIYGTMNKIGAMKGNKETPKGERMEAKQVAKYKGEAHTYDSNRPKRQVKSSYKGAAGAAY